jgi:hypothetical protein
LKIKCARFLAVAALLALLPIAALAADKDEGRIQLTTPVQLGTVHLKPGEYDVAWIPDGSHVKVNFLQNKKVLASAEGSIVEHKQPSPYDAVVLKSTSDGKAQTIDEIDFDNRTESLRIEPVIGEKTTAANNQ